MNIAANATWRPKVLDIGGLVKAYDDRCNLVAEFHASNVAAAEHWVEAIAKQRSEIAEVIYYPRDYLIWSRE